MPSLRYGYAGCSRLLRRLKRDAARSCERWLFLGNKESGKNAAIIYTIIENCRRNQIDPQAYLEWVLTELPKLSNQTNFNDYLPSAWAKTHRAQKVA